jgi:hypothetical protein
VGRTFEARGFRGAPRGDIFFPFFFFLPPKELQGSQSNADSWTADLDMNYGKSYQHSASANSLWHVCMSMVSLYICSSV